MELERTVRDRIVDVCVEGVSRHNMIDLIMRHGARAQIVETREDRQDENEDDQQFFDSEGWPPGEDSFVQPCIAV